MYAPSTLVMVNPAGGDVRAVASWLEQRMTDAQAEDLAQTFQQDIDICHAFLSRDAGLKRAGNLGQPHALWPLLTLMTMRLVYGQWHVMQHRTIL